MRIRRGTVVCQQWTELITDYLEGGLPERMVHAIDRHLADCPHCTEYLAQMRRTIEVTGRIPAEDVPADVVEILERAFVDYHSSPD